MTVAPEQPEPAASTPHALTGWLERLAAADGGQGGGAACGVLLGIAAALMEMVARYSTDDPRAGACAVRLSDRRGEAIRAADADGIHSAALGASLRVAEADPDRDRGIHQAALAAAGSSAALGAVGIALMAELALLSEIGDPNVRADLAVGAEALSAGIAAAAVNLRADLDLRDAHASDGFPDESAGGLAEAVRALQEARDAASAYAARLSEDFGDR
jgi:formiminotetrahydrofolate cyclodeaminase